MGAIYFTNIFCNATSTLVYFPRLPPALILKEVIGNTDRCCSPSKFLNMQNILSRALNLIARIELLATDVIIDVELKIVN